MSIPVDIVIPVYRGEAETRECIESVLAAGSATAAGIVVVDDASPEPAITAWLGELAREGRIELVTHAANRGFVASANEGMARHPERDVVLLNSDTEVAPGWLDRMRALVRSDRAIGTATPFSNNATICSYPRTLASNPLPAGETAASLDAAFAAANAGRTADIPTAVGFCMYITRECLRAIGAFDEERYGRGYGEEVDFCMRAARAGFRNVVAADVFVRHVGEVSFAGTSDARRREAQAVVDGLYPEFQERLREFIPADPLRGLRRRADLERLRRSPRPKRLFASEAEVLGARGEVEPLLLEAAADGHVRLRWHRPGEDFALWFTPDEAQGPVGSLLRAIGLAGEPPSPGPLPEIDERWLRDPGPGAAPEAGSGERARLALRRLSGSPRATALHALGRRLRRLLS